MKKITLLILTLFISLVGYSQLTEGFESTTGPDALPSTNWTLTSGNWAVFDNGVGLTQRWGINNGVATPPLVYAGTNAAYVNRENIGIGNTSEDFLATPLVTVPANGQLRFFARTFTNGNTGTLYQVKVAPSTALQTNPAAYTTQLVEYTEDQLTLDPAGVQNAYNIYTEKIISFPASMIGTQVYVAFVMKYNQTVSGISGDRWLLDNVNIVEQCLDPTALTATGILFNQANLSWANPSGATSWEIEVLPAASTSTGIGVVYSGALPYIATGLNANTAYKYYVRALCSSGFSSNWVGPFSFTTTTAPPICGGNFVDAAGPTTNYANNSDSTVTICPTVTGDLVTVTFTSFNTEANWDGLYVFDGNTIASPQIASTNGAGNVPGGLAGSFWGTTIPGPFTSSASNGCLTFRFRSDGLFNFAGWIANVTCAPTPTCPKPTAVIASAITATSVNLAWTNPSTATQWEILALPCGSPTPTPTSTGFVSAATNPFVLTGLNPDTCYDIYVRGICSVTDISDWSSPRTITTLQIPPACGGTFTDLGGSTANYTNNTDSTITICPTVVGEVVTVTFTSFNTQINADGLYIFNGNVITAPLFSSGNGAGTVPGALPGSYWGTTNPGSFTSTAANGCLTFRFRSGAATVAAGWVANVTCALPPTCAKPTSLVTSAVTYNSVNLAWTENGTATTWNVLALTCGSPFPSATATGWVTTTTNPYVLTGLNSETCYDIYVRSECSSSDLSNWSNPRTITTPIAPPVCGGTFTDPGGVGANYANGLDSTVTICPIIAGQLVTVTFTAFSTEANWDGLYVFDGNAITSPQIASTNAAGNVPGGLAGSYWGNAIPGPFTSSAANGCLTFRFRSDTSVNQAGWVANVTCAPPPTCIKPIALNASSITLTSALLGWTQLPNPDASISSNWEILVLPQGSPAPTATSTGFLSSSVNSITATGLVASNCYDFYVRSVCSPTDSSTWAGPFNFCTLNPPPISTSTTLYTNTQLVENVLLNTTCASVSSVTSSTGTNFGSTNGIGYFNKNGSNFPFEEGLVLTTGNAANAPGPNTTILSDGTNAWIGDTDLEAIILAATGAAMNSRNASKLEFNFVPLTDNISFNFIFASDEYGTFQCSFSDAFAFLLTDISTGITTNLAIVPSTTTPISVVTIRDALYNGGCASVNPAYFDTYYGNPNGENILGAPINFNGLTVPMTAASVVIPGNQYHIKLVIADRSDTAFDSAVFIEGGSFDIGNIELGSDFLESNGNALCAGDSFLIESGLNPAQYTFTWTQNGSLIPGETNPNLIVTQEATYSVNAQYIGTTCAATDSVIIEFYDPVSAGLPNNLITCNNLTYSEFDLSQNNTASLGSLNPANYNVAYYATLSDAENELNVLPILYTNTVPSNQTVYVRVENNISGCFEVLPFNLIVQDLTPQFTITSDFSICNGSTATITVTPINYNPTDVTYSWTLDSVVLPDTTASINITLAGTYQVVINNSGCIATGTTVVIVTPIPTPDAPANVTECNSYTLPVLTVGNYYTGTNGTGTMISAGDIIITSQLLYVFAQSGTTPNCTAENSFTITIIPLSVPTFNSIPNICKDLAAPALSTTSTNGYTGTWSPATIDTSVVGTFVYTFTPNAGQCAVTTTLSVTIDAPSIVPTFNPIANICQNGTAPSLSGTSINGISGTWNPATIDTTVAGTFTFTFTPNAAQCAVATTLNVTIDAPTLATFTQIAPICQNGTASTFTLTSTNGVTGTWNPTTIDTTTAGTNTYTFTPTAGLCATGTTMNITIHPTPVVAPIADVTQCDSYTLPILANGSYYDAAGGTGTMLSAGSTITTTQTIYIYDQSGTTPNCTDEESFLVTIINSPQFTIDGGCDGGVYVLEVIPSNFSNADTSFAWTDATGTAVGTNSATLQVATAGNYTCTVTVNTCSTAEIFAANDVACLLPKGISPNGDGLNDTFDLSGFNVKQLGIYNRYGAKVYSKTNYTNQWFGQTDSGNELPDGTYYFVIERNGEQTKSGWVYINREIK